MRARPIAGAHIARQRERSSMGWLRDFAYGSYLGPFPMMAIVGFVTYTLFLITAVLVSLKRSIPALRRIPVKVHRGLAIVALLFATFHLLLGIASYV